MCNTTSVHERGRTLLRIKAIGGAVVIVVVEVSCVAVSVAIENIVRGMVGLRGCHLSI